MTEISLPVTTLLAITLMAWLLVLSQRVIRFRQTGGALLGDGGDETLQLRIRAHANLVEYAPLFVILIAVMELQGGNVVILSLLSATFLGGRLTHGYALSFANGNLTGRIFGMTLTLSACGLAVVYGLISLLF